MQPPNRFIMLWLKVVVAACFVMSAKVCATRDVKGMSDQYLRLVTENVDDQSILISGEKAVHRIVTFNTTSATKESYNKFMTHLRYLLVSDLPRVHQIPLARNPATVPDSERFVGVTLIGNNNLAITLAISTTSLDVVGFWTPKHRFLTPQRFYYFPDTTDHIYLLYTNIPSGDRIELPLASSYLKEHRATTNLGMIYLSQSIEDLYWYRLTQLPDSLCVISQMISEAARFSYVEDFIGSIIAEGSTKFPSNTVVSLESQWENLSENIQRSRDGVFGSAVPLYNSQGKLVQYTSVTPGIVLSLAIMKFVCSSCQLPEPTIHISGPNDFCVDVRDHKYNNDNPIVLWTCRFDHDENQLWTLKSDGSIRSNDKCLTTKDYIDGANVVIYDCHTPITDAARWEVWDDGTIVNPKTALVLGAAPAGSQDTRLTLESNDYATTQGWVLSNSTEPIVTPIIGEGYLCIQTSYSLIDAVILRECTSKETKQEWAVYPDGSIRPNENRELCLTSDPFGPIKIALCDGSSSQRWSFKRDNTIANLQTALVMDAAAGFVYVSPIEDISSQKWKVWLL